MFDGREASLHTSVKLALRPSFLSSRSSPFDGSACWFGCPPGFRWTKLDTSKAGSNFNGTCLGPRTFLPDFYYALFAFYEPALTTIGFIGTLCDPETAHNAQAPWPSGTLPPAVFPKASVVTIIQLAHVCALMGLLNIFVLTAARQHLASQPALQEKIVRALLTPLLIGDVMHLYFTLWALGDDRWDIAQWSPMLWVSIVLGVSLMIPRVMWHLGIWRYVDARDRAPAYAESSRRGSRSEKR